MSRVRGIAKQIVPKALYPTQIARRVIDWNTRQRVYTGPFRGMHYVGASVGSWLYPKLLGTYELELHPIIDSIIKDEFETIIDVGAAEGYYAVGFAVRKPNVRVIAFETTPDGQQLIARMAAANNVTDRLTIYGECDPAGLAAQMPERGQCLVLMDVEGAENELLDPVRVPGLAHVTILVEIHDHLRAGTGDALKARFAATHAIREVPAGGRTAADFPIPAWKTIPLIPQRYYVQWMHERRESYHMRWFFMSPLSP